MNYELSQLADTNITYGVLVQSVDAGSPAARTGLVLGQQTVTIAGQQYTVGGDIIISINGARIVNSDALMTYLERFTLPGQTIQIGFIRVGQYHTAQVTVGSLPT